MRQPFSLYPRIVRSGKKVYYYTCWDGGTRVYRSTGCTTKAAALAEIKKRIEEGTLVSEDRSIHVVSFMEAMFEDGSEYLEDRARVGRPLKFQTLDNYRRAARRIAPYLGNRKLTEIDRKTLEHVQDRMKADGLSPGTINLTLVTLGIVYSWAIRIGVCRTNPCELVPRMQTNSQPKVWTKDEIAQLTTLEFWGGRVHPYLVSLVCAYTGMRLGEVLALQWSDIERGRIRVQRSLSHFQQISDTKNHKERYVPVPDFIVSELEKYKTSPLWVLSADGKNPVSYKAIQSLMGRHRRKFGDSCNKGWHSFRHYLNTQIASSEVPEAMVRAAIGHSSPVMTDLYYHAEVADLSPIENVQHKIEKTLAEKKVKNRPEPTT